MLVEIAVGDSYGFGFEYCDDNLVHNDVTHYVQHLTYGKEEGIQPGSYTDDTQMSIAVAECLLEGPWTKENITKHFIRAFKRDPRKGYAKHFQTFLESTTDEKDFLAKIKADSDRSGGAMRACPIGYMVDPREVVYMASLQASITHDTPNGRAAAEAAALATYYFIHDCGQKADVGKWIEALVPSHKWSEPYNQRIGAQGWMDVRAAITAVQEETSLKAILKRVIALGGDTDTAGAIAMGIGSQSREIAQDLPDSLYWGLESGPYGRDFLGDLSAKLKDRYQPEDRRH